MKFTKIQRTCYCRVIEIPEGLNAEQRYDNFIKLYMNHYITAFPLKSELVRRKNETIVPKPWILPWLKAVCDRKN